MQDFTLVFYDDPEGLLLSVPSVVPHKLSTYVK